MKDVAESQTPSIPVPIVVPGAPEGLSEDKNFDPKFLEAVERVLTENDELLKRLAS